MNKRDKTHEQKYRDRALERRVLHNQPEHPTEDGTVPTKSLSASSSTTQLSPAIPTDGDAHSDGIGNRLLKRMGWTEGSGLGTTGNGVVEPM